MTFTLPRRRWLQGTLACGLGFVLPEARACEFFTTTLRVTHPWTRASRPGDSDAVVCMRFDEVTQADRLIHISTPVAAGALIQRANTSQVAANSRGDVPINFLISADQVTEFTETGVHLRLTGLRHPLEIARSYPLTLTFAIGGVVEADLSIDYEALPA
ncbi:copper chaperone PCu(A)C [Roseateles koreensis]|uniref:Copper chaperone PCu(A)C n=1 Tax=Roseateles koreensis TaxID=2987526 RepID=A0ABT5KUZ3_9BURK|nr:copper chaperone PCu(A)C [Roseateles koreensis]MDC8786260.1 copper chaperone PCu(A)C [Roseateles koreensis]